MDKESIAETSPEAISNHSENDFDRYSYSVDSSIDG
jgi:hypothetical protein